MTRVHPQLAALQTALRPSTAGGPIPDAVANDVYGLIRGIKRKARFAEMHLAMLAGVKWDEIDDIGRRPAGALQPTHLTILLSEASLNIEHPGAVIDHVYLAFDGLIAALVNMTDTLGRLVNLGYALGIPVRQATLFAVRDHCTATSSLGVVLRDPGNMDWLSKVRDLRGRCQHADVEQILTSTTASLARREQPHVGPAYSWQSPARSTPLVKYAEDAVQATDACLDAAMGAILVNPASPMR